MIEALANLPQDALDPRLGQHPSEKVRMKWCQMLVENERFESLRPYSQDPNGHVRKFANKFLNTIYFDPKVSSRIVYSLYPIHPEIQLSKFLLQEEFERHLQEDFQRHLEEPIDPTSQNVITLSQGMRIARSLLDRNQEPSPEPLRRYRARVHELLAYYLDQGSGFYLDGNL